MTSSITYITLCVLCQKKYLFSAKLLVGEVNKYASGVHHHSDTLALWSIGKVVIIMNVNCKVVQLSTVVHTHTVKSFITVFSLNHRCHDADCTDRPGFLLHSERHITIRERAILHHYTDAECNYRLNIGSCFDIKSCHTHCTVNTYFLIDHTTCDALWSTHFLSVWLLHGLQPYKCVTAVNCYLSC